MSSPLMVQNLRKQYRRPGAEPFTAVDGISFAVRAGECFGLLGPNGAGKSTSIQCITGFYPATEGRVLIHGTDVALDPKRARSHLGYCSQDDTLDTDFAVRNQLIRHATFFKIPAAQARVRADRLLAQFNLTEKAEDLVESLSGGMRRRLQVARALLPDPKVLVLDEPTTGLDPEARRTLWDVIVAAREAGMAILLSTHYMDEAQRLCDRVAIISRGKILDVGSPNELIARYAPGESIDDEIRPGVIWKRPPNLEDVYMKLAGTRLADDAV